MKAIPLTIRSAILLAGATFAGTSLLPAAHADEGDDAHSKLNHLPSFVVASSLSTTTYDGISDDLLTAGLGKTGPRRGGARLCQPDEPTAAELRRLAIWSNYRALVDISANGGYGRFWGPNIDPTATTRSAKARSPATNTSPTPTTAAASKT